jgi:hypothetical protein
MTNATNAGEPAVLRLRTPHDVIAAVPYLLGFHPSGSLVAIGSEGPEGTCALRLDLPPAGRVAATAEHIAALLAGNGFPRAVLVGYGGPELVEPIVAATKAELAGHGVEVLETLRVDGGRFWTCGCTRSGCCPPEGTRYDVSTSPVAVQATVAGRVALADRAELARSVAPVGGQARDAMRRAGARAERRFGRRLFASPDRAAVVARLVEEGVAYVRSLPRRRLTDDEIAWLGVLLTHAEVRDAALAHTDADRLGQWRDVLRRVDERLAAAPACLAAYAAYLSGDGALANVALDRAVAADPDYLLAALLRDIFLTGVPPARLRRHLRPPPLPGAPDETSGRAP